MVILIRKIMNLWAVGERKSLIVLGEHFTEQMYSPQHFLWIEILVTNY